jgi:hypothetical protein
MLLFYILQKKKYRKNTYIVKIFYTTLNSMDLEYQHLDSRHDHVTDDRKSQSTENWRWDQESWKSVKRLTLIRDESHEDMMCHMPTFIFKIR